MRNTVLIVPGYHGSGPAHWQSWLETQLPEAERVQGIDWGAPVLDEWVHGIRRQIQATRGPVWLVAHSFGCLAAVSAGLPLADKVAGALLVAPADPERFSAVGPRGNGQEAPSLSDALPRVALPFTSLLVASSNDPWLSMTSAVYWSECWASHLTHIGPAGHINTESGFGPWPEGLQLLANLRTARGHFPLGDIEVGRDPAPPSGVERRH